MLKSFWWGRLTGQRWCHLAQGFESVWSVHVVSISRHQYFIRLLVAILNLHTCQSSPAWHAETWCFWSSIYKHAQELTSLLWCLPSQMCVHFWLCGRRWSVERGNRLDVSLSPLGDCRDLWEDDLISNVLLSWLSCRLVRSRYQRCVLTEGDGTRTGRMSLEYGLDIFLMLDLDWHFFFEMDTAVSAVLFQ